MFDIRYIHMKHACDSLKWTRKVNFTPLEARVFNWISSLVLPYLRKGPENETMLMLLREINSLCPA